MSSVRCYQHKMLFIFISEFNSFILFFGVNKIIFASLSRSAPRNTPSHIKLIDYLSLNHFHFIIFRSLSFSLPHFSMCVKRKLAQIATKKKKSGKCRFNRIAHTSHWSETSQSENLHKQNPTDIVKKLTLIPPRRLSRARSLIRVEHLVELTASPSPSPHLASLITRENNFF